MLSVLFADIRSGPAVGNNCVWVITCLKQVASHFLEQHQLIQTGLSGILYIHQLQWRLSDAWCWRACLYHVRPSLLGISKSIRACMDTDAITLQMLKQIGSTNSLERQMPLISGFSQGDCGSSQAYCSLLELELSLWSSSLWQPAQCSDLSELCAQKMPSSDHGLTSAAAKQTCQVQRSRTPLRSCLC